MRRTFGLLGVVAVAGAVAIAIAPGLAAGVRVGRLHLIGLSAGSGLLALRAIQSRMDAAVAAATTEDPAGRRPLPTPGRDVDVAFARGILGPRTPAAPGRGTLRDRLEPVVVAAVARRERCSRARAEAMLDDGSWTDDPLAAAFFTGTTTDSDRSIGGRVRLAFASRGTRGLASARRVIHAIAPDGFEWPDGRRLSESATVEAPGGARSDGPAGPDRRATNRWRGIAALPFAAGAVGILFGRPAVLLLGVVGVAYAVFAGRAAPPSVDVRAERALDDPTPDPGDEVAVRLTVTNDGTTTLPDLRIVDGVPARLAVTDGAARVATALRPGESETVSYAVEAARGRHAFGPIRVIARDWSGAVEVDREHPVETALVCSPRLRPLGGFPLRSRAIEFTGDAVVDSGGDGVTFEAVREYRQDDPLSRIDWNRLARTGRPATVELSHEHVAEVVLVVDVREIAYLGDVAGAPAVEHAIDAAGRVAATLLDAGHRVGVASFGPAWTWLPPNLGRAHRRAIRRVLTEGDGFEPLPPERPPRTVRNVSRLRRHLAAGAQVVFLSALTDDYASTLARKLDAGGSAVTVVAPDVTRSTTPGGVVAGIERDERIDGLRRAGVPVVDWDPAGESLAVAVAEHRRRRAA